MLYSGVIGSRRGLKGVKPSCLQRRINYDSDRMLITEDLLPLPLFTIRSHESPLSIVDFSVFNKCGLQTTIRSGFLYHTCGLFLFPCAQHKENPVWIMWDTSDFIDTHLFIHKKVIMIKMCKVRIKQCVKT